MFQHTLSIRIRVLISNESTQECFSKESQKLNSESERLKLWHIFPRACFEFRKYFYENQIKQIITQ